METTAHPPLRTSAGLLPGPDGVLVGHADATGDGWLSGCTVVLPPPGTVGAVAVGGGAPGTRETDALAPGTLVSTVDAVVLSGGSAYGLATADGVVRWCERHGRGFVVSAPDAPGPVVRVPVVPAAVVFDLGRGGDPSARPDARFGEAACEATVALGRVGATAEPVPEGQVGAGTGCRVAGGTAPGGVGVAGGAVPGTAHRVGALVVANAAGTPVGQEPPVAPATGSGTGSGLLNTTLVVVVTDAVLDVATAGRVAQAAHAGLARAVDPSHTVVDGDVVLALATGSGTALTGPRDQVALEAAAAHAVTQAFARAVTG
ncbi:P1 family peptidase [Aquipuribacter sp. MA13-6]|uniref:P1 family peptidase n=1 Tax=unclassified Aquipuribacter TaxID=2635084 RepID=UPI003EECD55F